MAPRKKNLPRLSGDACNNLIALRKLQATLAREKNALDARMLDSEEGVFEHLLALAVHAERGDKLARHKLGEFSGRVVVMEQRYDAVMQELRVIEDQVAELHRTERVLCGAYAGTGATGRRLGGAGGDSSDDEACRPNDVPCLVRAARRRRQDDGGGLVAGGGATGGRARSSILVPRAR
jgi:hypothetical protein